MEVTKTVEVKDDKNSVKQEGANAIPPGYVALFKDGELFPLKGQWFKIVRQGQKREEGKLKQFILCELVGQTAKSSKRSRKGGR